MNLIPSDAVFVKGQIGRRLGFDAGRITTKYDYKTIKHLPKLRTQWHELVAKRDKLEEEYAELTDKVGNERLSGLLVEGQGYSVVCDKVVEKVVDSKYNR